MKTSRRLLPLVLLLLVLAGTAGGWYALRASPASTASVAVSLPVPPLAPGRTGSERGLLAVVAYGRGFVAAGLEHSGAMKRPLFERSADAGASWQFGTEQPGRTRPSGYVDFLATDGHSLLALGGGDGDTLTWTSVDGISWTPHAADKAAFLAVDDVHAVAALPGHGWIAVGETVVDGRTRGVLWTSRDGATWTRRTAAQLRLPLKRQGDYFAAVATHGAQVVIGGTDNDERPRDHLDAVAFWASSDAGAHITRVPVDPAIGGTGTRAHVRAVVWSGSRWLAVAQGGEETDHDFDSVLMTSKDGRTWTGEPQYLYAEKGSDFPTSLAATVHGRVVIAGTLEGDALLYERQPDTFVSHLHDTAEMTADHTQVLRGAAALGEVVVAVGADQESGDFQPLVLRGATAGAIFSTVPQPAAAGLRPYPHAVAAAQGPDGLSVVGEAANDAAWWVRTDRGITALALPAVPDPQTRHLDDVAVRGATSVAVGGVDADQGQQGLVLLRSGSGNPKEVASKGLWESSKGPRVLTAVTAWSRGFVTVGYARDDAIGALVATSSDGHTWRAASGPAFGKGSYLDDVAGDDRQLIAVGGVDSSGAAWSSSDGRTWTRHAVPTPAGFDSAVVSHITKVSGRWLAVGFATKQDSNTAATTWTSADGSSWSPASLVEAGAVGSEVVDVVVSHGRALVVGEVDRTKTDFDARAWTSADLTHWSAVPSLNRPGEGDERWTVAVEDAGSVLLLGQDRLPLAGGRLLSGSWSAG